MSNKRKSQRKRHQPLGSPNKAPKSQAAKNGNKTAIDYLVPFGKPEGDTFQSLINPDYFLAQPGARGIRSTLASQLCRILVLAQHLFGERDPSYTFLGFEFANGAPRLIRQHDGKFLIIQLYLNAMHNPVVAYAQVAHEAIHMLSPCYDRPISVLEEGLAHFFSNWYILNDFGVMPPKSEMPSYDEAFDLVDKLMCTDGMGIKKMRQEEPIISKFTTELIMRHYPTISEDIANSLTAPFDRG
jgi:hypothetical protein